MYHAKINCAFQSLVFGNCLHGVRVQQLRVASCNGAVIIIIIIR